MCMGLADLDAPRGSQGENTTGAPAAFLTAARVWRRDWSAHNAPVQNYLDLAR